MRNAVRSVYRSAKQFGIDLRGLGNARHIARYLGDARAFVARGGKIDSYYPVLHDYTDSSGVASGHYFHQDLLVAQLIHAEQPARHADVASRVDGFVAHVASFREIDVFDIRPLESIGHPNIRFIQADLMQPQPEHRGVYPSVSCLHALEHFGLGRYTDAIDPDGHRRGFAAIAELVAPGGTFYVSLPVGRPRVEFNAQRVFDPSDVPTWDADRFTLERFDYVGDDDALRTRASPADAAGLEYGCGIYTLRRRS